jgi:hypothetical protein
MFVRRPELVGSPDSNSPSGFTAASQFGAIGDGVRDDTDELQNALDKARLVWLKSNGVYRMSRRLTLREGRQLASNGTATVLMASGVSGFSNRLHRKNEQEIYSPSGTGLLLQGAGIRLRDVYIVKEYEDDRYVIGIEIRSAQDVILNRVRMRGFSWAPGIITIRGSRNVTVSNSLIHASCTTSTNAITSGGKSSFQITGITVDDSPLILSASERITISNNVIVDLFMKPVTSRGDQTDGINFSGIRTGDDSVIEHNYVNHVAEGLDLFGKMLLVANNTIGGREHGIKIIHGATNIRIINNHITGKPSIAGIGAWTGDNNADRQVQNIDILRNVLDMRYTTKPGILVDRTGTYRPLNIFIDGNRSLVNDCKLEAVSCDNTGAAPLCRYGNNDKFHEGVFPCS